MSSAYANTLFPPLPIPIWFVLVSSGFIQCSDNLFVPHFFEPFDADRQEVKIAFRSKEPFSCTKGDSDLDRPNQG